MPFYLDYTLWFETRGTPTQFDEAVRVFVAIVRTKRGRRPAIKSKNLHAAQMPCLCCLNKQNRRRQRDKEEMHPAAAAAARIWVNCTVAAIVFRAGSYEKHWRDICTNHRHHLLLLHPKKKAKEKENNRSELNKCYEKEEERIRKSAKRKWI